MYQAAIFCRGWATNENSESFHVDWKRETIFHFSRTIHRIHLFLLLLQLESELLNSLVSFSKLLHRALMNLYLRSLHFLHFVLTSNLRISKAFSFRNNSSCNRVCSRRDSTNSFCTSCSALFCASVRFCKSPMHLLSDSWSSLLARSDLAWFSKWSLLPSSRVPLKFDRFALPNTELHIWFLCSLHLDENNAAGLPEALWSSDEWDVCALTSLSWTTIASGFPEALWAYSGEVSNICNSPSSRSESAMLSIGSSKCIWD